MKTVVALNSRLQYSTLKLNTWENIDNCNSFAYFFFDDNLALNQGEVVGSNLVQV